MAGSGFSKSASPRAAGALPIAGRKPGTAWALMQRIDHPDPVNEWMGESGVGAYPPVFVGRLAHLMRIDENA